MTGRPTPTVVRIEFLALAVGCGAVVWMAPRSDWDLALLGILLVLAAVSDANAVQVTTSVYVSASFIAIVSAAVLLGASAAGVIGVGAILTTWLIKRYEPQLLLINVVTYIWFPVVAGGTFHAAVESLGLATSDSGFYLLVFAVFALALVINLGFILAFTAHDRGLPFARKAAREALAPMLVPELMSATTAVGVTYTYLEVGLGAVALFGAVVLGFQFLAAALVRARERADELQRVAASRQHLVAQALNAEERERRALADALHDETIQNLLTARRSLDGSQDDVSLRRARRALDRGISQVRDAIFELHPAVLTEAGLPAALGAVAQQQAEAASITATVQIDPHAVGFADQLLFSLGREFLVNVTRHARATEAKLVVTRTADEVRLVVSDDGCGIDAGRPQEALRDGHLGLASARERTEALGGIFSIETRAQQGTVVSVLLPINGADAPVQRS